jgi:glycosyltransferase involved in cell wall biosynthesis
MNILISSYPFFPSIGGIEEVTGLLASEFVTRGHVVKVVTMTPSKVRDDFPFDVVRRPTVRELMRAIKWCDVYLQGQISLKFGWPLLFFKRPCVMALLHPLYEQVPGSEWKQWIKRAVIGLSDHVVACSHAIARQLGRADITVIPDPYRDRDFRCLSDTARRYDLVFLGRLVSDKGLGLLIEALASLRKRGMTPSLMVVGSGPERQSLQSRCKALGLTHEVHFAGALPGDAVPAALNQCRIMVVPSIVEEGFGIVALEGIACGCVVVAAEAGGLPEAVGRCGVTFPKGNVTALADRLAELLGDEAKIATLRSHAPNHLSRHRPAAVAEAYLSVLQRACPTGRAGR